MCDWVVNDLANFSSLVFTAACNFQTDLTGTQNELYHILGVHWPITDTQNVVLDFRHLAPFRNKGILKAIGVENWGQILHFLTPVKLREDGRDMDI